MECGLAFPILKNREGVHFKGTAETVGMGASPSCTQISWITAVLQLTRHTAQDSQLPGSEALNHPPASIHIDG